MEVTGLQALHLSAVFSRPSIQLKYSKRGAIPRSPLKQKFKIATRAKLRDGIANWVEVNRSVVANAAMVGTLTLSISLCGLGKAIAKEGVNKPEMLPKEFTPLIDVAGFLSTSQMEVEMQDNFSRGAFPAQFRGDGAFQDDLLTFSELAALTLNNKNHKYLTNEESRMIEVIYNLEKDTGFKLRVLAQNYPETPGLAVRDFWQVDDNTIVFVADPTFGNILNFNVGASVDLDIPRSFWSRLAGKYGNIFYWREKGEDIAIEAAVSAINSCLREPLGPYACSDIK